MLSRILLLTFIGLTYGITTETSVDLGSQLKLIFNFPEFGLPTVRCELSSDSILNGWLTQTLFFKHDSLKKFGLIVKAIVDEDGIVSCGFVPAADDDEIKRKERECREQCTNDIDDNTTPSSSTEDSSEENTTPSTDDEGSSPSTGEVTEPSTGEVTEPSTDEKDSSESSEGTEPSTNEEGSSPSTGEVTEPSTNEEDSSESSEGTEPSTNEEGSSPSTGEVTEPSTGEATEPSTDEEDSSESSEVTEPSTNEEDSSESSEGTEPSTNEEGSSPSTGEVTEPSTDDEGSSPSSEVTEPSPDEEGSSPSTGEDRDDDSSTPNTGGGGGGDDDGNGSGSGRCKRGFIYIRRADSCYWFSNYTAQWYDAECACASLGGTLAVINNQIEQDEITGRIFGSSWIGLNDNKLEDDFVWRDGSEVTFTKWSLDGSLNSEEKNCVELSENYNFSWVAENCEEQRRFVCEEAETEEQITTPVCPTGWTLNEETNSCYFISDKKLPWAAAKLLCSDIGGVLATIHNKDASDFLKNMMSKAGENAWIGCQTDDSGRWSWNDGSSLDFTNWGSGEPKTSSGLISTLLGGSKNFCGQMDYIQSFWSARDCSNKLKAICRRLPEFLPRSVCPEGWTFDGEGNCFKASSSEADYETAQKACNLSAVGGKLVIPNTDTQNSFVSDFLKKNNIKKVWAGATVEEASKFHIGFISGFFHNLLGFSDRKCIQIDETGTWSAQGCDYTSRFVCKVSKFKAHVMEKLNFIP